MIKHGAAHLVFVSRQAHQGKSQPQPPSRCASRQVQPVCSRPTGAPARVLGVRVGAATEAVQAVLDRRAVLLAAGAAALWPGQAAAEAEGATQPLTAPPQPASQQGFKTFNERDFVLEVPQGFSEYQDPQKAAEATEFGTGGRPKSTYERAAALTPLRVKFSSEDGKELLTVIQRNASEIKQSLLQITDVSQLGSVSDVAKLLLPGEVKVLAADSVTIQQEPRDTGTLLGVVQVPPQTIYRYTFRTRGQRAHLVVVAKAGKIYLAAGSAREERWPQASDRLKAAVVSFRLI